MQPICPVHEIAPLIDPLRAEEAASLETAVSEIIRSGLQSLGPVTVDQLARPISLSTVEVARALLKLEQEGCVMQGHFDPHNLKSSGASAACWRAYIATG
jgi:ATP-dependent helicase Lhr and Lhr-like helicase